jgi:hypothetical protein
MAVGDTNLYFGRDTKVYLVQNALVWEIPVLNGYGFTQGTNTSEVTLNEMSDSTGASRRGRAVFTDSIAPAEWSFDTYVRPVVASTVHGAIEEPLWANFVSPAVPTANAAPGGLATWAPAAGNGLRAPITRTGTTNMDVAFDHSNKTALGTFDLYFVLGASKAASANYAASEVTTIYRANGCSVNEVSISFDIDGISTLSWSGSGTVLQEQAAFDASAADVIRLGVDSTTNFIRNRLTQLVATSSVNGTKTYALTLTGGTITLSNNMTYLTPEVMGRVNSPLGHVTGTRTIGGSFTCYLDEKTNGSIDLFSDLTSSTALGKITNSFALDFYVGGKSGGDAPVGPGLQFKIPNAHLNVPAFDPGDVVSVSVDFSALPTTIGATDEVQAIRYVGV